MADGPAWMHRLAVAALLMLVLGAASRAAELCLPALAEGGWRLHEMPAPSVYWLQLLLRQHEACRTADEPRERLRVFFYGSDGVLGYPADDTTVEDLNRLWESTRVPARAFNFGFATANAVKDMLIVRESLRYRPDVIVYGVMPGDFRRYGTPRYSRYPLRQHARVERLMRASGPTVVEFAAEDPAGLGAQLARYRREYEKKPRRWWRPSTWPVREVLAFAWTAVATRLRAAGERMGILAASGEPAVPHTCGDTRRTGIERAPSRAGGP